MNKKMLYLATVLVCAAELNSCDEPENNHPIVGTWETTDPTGWDDVDISRYQKFGPDWWYQLTWTFNQDGSYGLEFHYVTVASREIGIESGTYQFLSDSIMAFDRTEFDLHNTNVIWTDTLHMLLLGSRLVTTGVYSTNPYRIDYYRYFWQRIK